MNKIISTTYLPSIGEDSPIQDLLFEASELISKLGTSEIPISERAKEILTKARALIGKAIFNAEEAIRLRSSSLTSTGSLGDRLAVRDKEDYLYTYPWVSRDSGIEKGQPNAIWARGNNFRSWAEHPHRRLPLPQSGLNCWEAVSILLYLYHAVTKEDIRTAYRSANYEGDSTSVNVLFGLEDKEFTHEIPVQDLHNFVETGDVLVFHSNKGSEMGHVALVLDSFEKLWVASHWSLPKEKMIKITPNRIFTLSRDSVIERFNKEIREVSDRITQYQANISSMLEIASLSPERITDLKKDYIVDRSCEDVSALMQYVKEKRESEYKEFSEFEIQPYEKQAINQLYLQVRQLIEAFESAIKKYREKQDFLGVVYDYIDSFEQMSPFYSPLYDLEYLENDTITVSTKFRSFFQD